MLRLRSLTDDDVDWLVAEHARHYTDVERFDASFAPLVRRVLTDFLGSHDPAAEAGWVAQTPTGNGSLLMCRDGARTARLRLFYLAAGARGKGHGRAMLAQATEFARAAGYMQMRVATYESHRAACALYRACGWQMTDRRAAHAFGADRTELHFIYDLKPAD